MRVVAKGEGVGFQAAVRSAGEIGINFGEDAVGIVESLVNVREEQMNVGEVRVETDGVEGATLRIRNPAGGILHEAETVFAGSRIGSQQESLANKGFGLRVIATTVKDHGETKKRRGVGGFGGVESLLEIFAGLVHVAEFVFCDSEIVIRGVIVGSELGGVLEIGEAGLWIPAYEKLAALFKGVGGFAGHGELLDGNDLRFGGGGRGELGEAGQGGEYDQQEKKERFWKVHRAPRAG